MGQVLDHNVAEKIFDESHIEKPSGYMYVFLAHDHGYH